MRVVVAWMAWESTGEPAAVGGVAFLYLMPTVVLGPFFGVMVDRVSPKVAASCVQAGFLLLTLALLALSRAEALGIVSLSAIALATGIVIAAHHPTRLAMAPRLVAPDLVPSVVNGTSLNFNLAAITGPMVGGWMLASYGATAVLVVQLLLFVPLQFAIPRLSLRPPKAPWVDVPGGTELLAGVSSGLRFVFADRAMVRALAILAAVMFVGRGTLELLPTLADGIYGKGAAGYGVMAMTAGLGAIGASFWTTYFGGEVAPSSAVVLVGMLAFAGTGLLTHVGAWMPALLLVGVIGFACTVVSIASQTSFQMTLNEALHGRIMSLWIGVQTGAVALGALFLSLAADRFGLSVALTAVPALVAAALMAFLTGGGPPVPVAERTAPDGEADR